MANGQAFVDFAAPRIMNTTASAILAERVKGTKPLWLDRASRMAARANKPAATKKRMRVRLFATADCSRFPVSRRSAAPARKHRDQEIYSRPGTAAAQQADPMLSAPGRPRCRWTRPSDGVPFYEQIPLAVLRSIRQRRRPSIGWPR